MALGVYDNYSPRRRSSGLWTAVMTVLMVMDGGTSSPALRQGKGGMVLKQLDKVSAVKTTRSRHTKTIGDPLSWSQGTKYDDESSGSKMDASHDITRPGNDSAADTLNGKYYQCFDSLEKASSDGSTVTQGDYLRFLYLFSEGALAYTNFSQLPALYTLLFYATACSSGRDCVTSQPVILVNKTEFSLMWIEFFCEEIQWYTYTSTVIGFDYSVRYEPTRVSSEMLDKCLSSATEALLYAYLGCGNSTTTGRRLGVSPRVEGLLLSESPSHFPPGSGRSLTDWDQPTTIQQTTSNAKSQIDCPYALQHQVENIIPMRMLSKAIVRVRVSGFAALATTYQHNMPYPAPQSLLSMFTGRRSRERPNGLWAWCVLPVEWFEMVSIRLLSLSLDDLLSTVQFPSVQNTITITSVQSDSTSDHDLYAKVIGILRQGIDTNEFESYFPSLCQLA
jgi:hypothetical protein